MLAPSPGEKASFVSLAFGFDEEGTFKPRLRENHGITRPSGVARRDALPSGEYSLSVP
jgi:hypothetical protein